jgi:hypothetical protein
MKERERRERERECDLLVGFEVWEKRMEERAW